MQGGLGVGGGGGGKGGRGIFNIGKAHVTKADKNSKNKVSFPFVLLNIAIDQFIAVPMYLARSLF
jgi:hypothetical protein